MIIPFCLCTCGATSGVLYPILWPWYRRKLPSSGEASRRALGFLRHTAYSMMDGGGLVALNFQKTKGGYCCSLQLQNGGCILESILWVYTWKTKGDGVDLMQKKFWLDKRKKTCSSVQLLNTGWGAQDVHCLCWEILCPQALSSLIQIGSQLCFG